MEIIIKATPKEIADLIAEVQNCHAVDISKFLSGINIEESSKTDLHNPPIYESVVLEGHGKKLVEQVEKAINSKKRIQFFAKSDQAEELCENFPDIFSFLPKD